MRANNLFSVSVGNSTLRSWKKGDTSRFFILTEGKARGISHLESVDEKFMFHVSVEYTSRVVKNFPTKYSRNLRRNSKATTDATRRPAAVNASTYIGKIASRKYLESVQWIRFIRTITPPTATIVKNSEQLLLRSNEKSQSSTRVAPLANRNEDKRLRRS